jgi:hypothetical protein
LEPPLELDSKLGWSLDLFSLKLFSISIPAVLSDRNNSGSEFWLWDSNPIPPFDTLSFHWRWAPQVPSPHCRVFHLRSLPLSPESLSPPRSLVHSRGSPHLLPPKVACFHSFCWPSGLQFCPPPHTWPCSPLPLPVLSSTWVSSSLCPHDCFLLPPKWDWGILTSTRASCLSEMFFSNSPVLALATTVTTECQVLTWCPPPHRLMENKASSNSRCAYPCWDRSLEAIAPAPMGEHTSHLALANIVREQHDACEPILYSPGISQPYSEFCCLTSDTVWGRLREAFGCGLNLSRVWFSNISLSDSGVMDFLAKVNSTVGGQVAVSSLPPTKKLSTFYHARPPHALPGPPGACFSCCTWRNSTFSSKSPFVIGSSCSRVGQLSMQGREGVTHWHTLRA